MFHTFVTLLLLGAVASDAQSFRRLLNSSALYQDHKCPEFTTWSEVAAWWLFGAFFALSFAHMAHSMRHFAKIKAAYLTNDLTVLHRLLGVKVSVYVKYIVSVGCTVCCAYVAYPYIGTRELF
jgi:hypothetical protein